MKQKDFNKLIEDYIQEELNRIDEHNQIKEILKPLIGKPINKRTLNQKKIGDFKYKRQYGMLYICGKYEHLIGFEGSENIIAIDKMDYSRGYEYFDACNGYAALERIEKIKNTDLTNAFAIFQKIDHYFKSLVNAFEEIEAHNLGCFNFPPYYEILAAIYKGKTINLNDFTYIVKELQNESTI